SGRTLAGRWRPRHVASSVAMSTVGSGPPRGEGCQDPTRRRERTEATLPSGARTLEPATPGGLTTSGRTAYFLSMLINAAVNYGRWRSLRAIRARWARITP